MIDLSGRSLDFA